MYTEAEAAELDCCGPLPSGVLQFGASTMDRAGNRRLCVASRCMAWRWAQKRNPAWKPEGGMMSYPQSHPDDKAPMYMEDDKHGYCGLAGRP